MTKLKTLLATENIINDLPNKIRVDETFFKSKDLQLKNTDDS
jgi:hypothetical protein